MAMANALKMTWLGRLGGWRRRGGTARAPIVASRDLPPLDPMTLLALPRSPAPLSDEALVFARDAARRVARSLPQARDGGEDAEPLSIAEGADLRALLDRVRQSDRRRKAIDQANQARKRLVEQLNAGKAGARPALQLVADRQAKIAAIGADSRSAEELDLDRALQEALTSALGTLKQISELSRR